MEVLAFRREGYTTQVHGPDSRRYVSPQQGRKMLAQNTNHKSS